MSAFASWEVQQAVYARLAADAGVRALIGNPVRLYDILPPGEPTFPYAVIGEEFAVDWGAKGLAGQEIEFVLHSWSRARGRKETKQILAALHASLHDAELTVSGAHAVLCRYAFSEVLADPDGRTFHGVIRFTILVHA